MESNLLDCLILHQIMVDEGKAKVSFSFQLNQAQFQLSLIFHSIPIGSRCIHQEDSANEWPIEQAPQKRQIQGVQRVEGIVAIGDERDRCHWTRPWQSLITKQWDNQADPRHLLWGSEAIVELSTDSICVPGLASVHIVCQLGDHMGLDQRDEGVLHGAAIWDWESVARARQPICLQHLGRTAQCVPDHRSGSWSGFQRGWERLRGGALRRDPEDVRAASADTQDDIEGLHSSAHVYRPDLLQEEANRSGSHQLIRQKTCTYADASATKPASILTPLA